MTLMYYLSGRRDDASGAAQGFRTLMVARYGLDNVLYAVERDVDGPAKRAVIEGSVARADVFIALITHGWADGIDPYGRDAVGVELGAALRRGLPLFAVLVDDASMPRSADLPAALAALAGRSAVRVGRTTFAADVNQLLDDLDEIQLRPDVPPAVQTRSVGPAWLGPDPVLEPESDPAGTGFLDMVRNKRFRMARKAGYEVLEVDEFVDAVEETLNTRLAAIAQPSRRGVVAATPLSTEDIRHKRFRMARKSGYEVLEVDEFVDEVEEEFARLDEIADRLPRVPWGSGRS